MTSQDQNMATFVGWLEEKCGQIQAQYVLDEITDMQIKKNNLECMEIMLLADLVYGYRKELLQQIRSFKELRAQEGVKPLVDIRVRRKLKNMETTIRGGIKSWSALRRGYFSERSRYMEQCKYVQNGFVMENACSSSMPRRRRA